MGNLLESLAYAIARGFFRAWFDAQDERALAVEEVPDARDRARALRFRDAVRKRVLPPGSGSDPGPVGPSPSGGGS